MQDWPDTTGLGILLRDFLHQDFIEDYGDVWSAVRAFRGEESAETIRQAHDELAQIVAAQLEEHVLQELLIKEYFCYYRPAGDGLTYKEWTKQLLTRLRAFQ